MTVSAVVFFSREQVYIAIISARPKGRAPSYPEPAPTPPWVVQIQK